MIYCRISKDELYLSWNDAAYIIQEVYKTYMLQSHMWFGISTAPDDKESLRYSTWENKN